MLISLPDGLSVSGVTLWAIRSAQVLAARGHAVTLMLHEEPRGQKRISPELPSGVNAVRLQNVKPLREADGDLSAFIPAYRDEVQRLSEREELPVVFLPTLLGDSFGIAAALSITHAERLRIIGWQQADTAYDLRLLTYYEPVLASFAGVSTRIARSIADAIPRRSTDVSHMPNPVDVSESAPIRAAASGGPLRIVYAGRIEHKQKRVLALLEMSDELAGRKTPHTLTLLGDGPAMQEIAHAIVTGDRGSRIVARGAVEADDVRRILRESDCFVLASRYEGLSVAMIEAMAEGCVPVVTDVASGAAEAITHGENGMLVSVPPDANDHEAGVCMADAVQSFAASDRERCSLASWRRARDGFSLKRYASRLAALIDSAAAAPPRAWPTNRAPAFTSSSAVGAGSDFSGSVPPNAHQRLSDLLKRLAGRSIVLHGSGRHTIELAGVLSSAKIVAITDDDPGRWGRQLFGWPIIAPTDVRKHGGSDVVISSWLHADEIYARREVYLQQGVRVHHLYRDASAAATDSYSCDTCSN